MRHSVTLVASMLVGLCLTCMPAAASERYALVVIGASGGPQYAEKYDTWRETFVDTLRNAFEYPVEHLVVLDEDAAGGSGQPTRENVRGAISNLRSRMKQDDLLLVLLIGHGTGGDGDAAKFNLVGPDLDVGEWAALLRALPGRLVFVNTSSGSFPFLEALAGRNRIVVTANDSAAQQFETVFPGFFIEAFGTAAADLDKNGKVSLWEAFTFASERVRRWFEEKGQLATERAMLDDTGDGIGHESAAAGTDGVQARITYLQPDPQIIDSGDSERTALLRRRAALGRELEELRARKEGMPVEEYDAALERLLLEIAQVDRRLRSRS